MHLKWYYHLRCTLLESGQTPYITVPCTMHSGNVNCVLCLVYCLLCTVYCVLCAEWRGGGRRGRGGEEGEKEEEEEEEEEAEASS